MGVDKNDNTTSFSPCEQMKARIQVWMLVLLGMSLWRPALSEESDRSDEIYDAVKLADNWTEVRKDLGTPRMAEEQIQLMQRMVKGIDLQHYMDRDDIQTMAAAVSNPNLKEEESRQIIAAFLRSGIAERRRAMENATAEAPRERERDEQNQYLTRADMQQVVQVLLRQQQRIDELSKRLADIEAKGEAKGGKDE